MQGLMQFWYDWGVFVGVSIAAAVAIYVWLDSYQRRATGALWPRLLSLAGVLLTLPSLYFRVTKQAELAADLIVRFFAGESVGNDSFQLFAYLGLAGLLLALVALIWYLASRREPAVVVVAPRVNPPTEPIVSNPPPVTRPVEPTKMLDPAPVAQAWVVIRNGRLNGKQFSLGTSSPNVIGRDPSRADILIDEDTVSREHARVKFESGQFVLYDMASTGGTYVNGASVQRQMLYDNDRIRVGRVEMVYKRA